MLAESVLVRPQDLHLRARAPTCLPLLRHWEGNFLCVTYCDSKTKVAFTQVKIFFKFFDFYIKCCD